MPRIASLISSGTEIVYGLGLQDSLVAVSHECDYPPAAAGKPRVTRSHVDSQAGSGAIDDQVKALLAAGQSLYEIDVELLALLRPDLILTQAQCDVCAVRYEDVTAAVAQRPELRSARVIALNPQSLGDMLADIERVGQAAGAPAEAASFRGQLERRIASVRAQAAPPGRTPPARVACIEWLDPPMLSGNWLPKMVALAGGRHDLTRPGEHSPFVTWDALLAFDPQVILVMPCGFDLDRTLAEWSGTELPPDWPAVSAVRDGRVFAVDGNAYFNRSGPRLVDSLEILAHLMHPERCPAPATVNAARSWRQL